MALKGFLALVDEKLSEAYNYIAPDPAKVRKPFLNAIDKAAKQFDEGKQPRGANAMWSANNNVVRFTPKVGGVPVEIDGKTALHIPAERFANALAELRKEVEAGELDDALSVDPAKNPDRAARSQSEAKPSRAGWTPERREKMRLAREAKKAAK